jgi:2-hydroxy-6-oxonona-2,4-dienedioate hydrolase
MPLGRGFREDAEVTEGTDRIVNEPKYREAEAKLWSAYGLTPRERFVRLPSTGTRVRVQEVGEGEPVLLLHGGPNTGSTWVPLVQAMPGFRHLLVDRPGTGLSEPFVIRPSNLADVGARFVGDVLDGLGLERAHVVASSFGGHLALRSAAHDPSRFARMVQLGCPALVAGDSTPDFMKAATNPVVRWLVPRLPTSIERQNATLRQIGHGASLDADRIPRVFSEWYLAMWRHTDTAKNEFVMIGGGIDDPTIKLTPDVYAAAKVPTSFLWGVHDAFGDERLARNLVEMMPDAELTMVPEAGHLPWIDFPERMGSAATAFLTRDGSWDGATSAVASQAGVATDVRTPESVATAHPTRSGA